MSTLYYKVVGTLDGEREQLFGSFVKADCIGELDAERFNWKLEGYKALKVIASSTEDSPDMAVYTKTQLASNYTS